MNSCNLKKITKAFLSVSVCACLFSACNLSPTPAYTKEYMVLVPGATFTAGDDFNSWNDANYKGAFKSGITYQISSFYMSKCEVTKKLFSEVMEDPELNTLGVSADISVCNENNSKYILAPGEVDELRPVDNLTWYDAIYFCNLLSKRDGLQQVYKISNPKVLKESSSSNIYHIKNASVTQDLSKNGYRLPTEYEWEFAFRGGKPRSKEWFYAYSGSDSANSSPKSIDSGLDSAGWYSYNICNNGITSSQKGTEGNVGYGSHQVGLKKPNRLGLYDMSGNVDEWQTTGPYQTYTNPATGKVSGPDQYYALRGGCWSYFANYNSAGHYFIFLPENNSYANGMRLCRNAY